MVYLTLTNIVLENNHLTITIDLCYWMQSDYKEDEAETELIELKLNNKKELDESNSFDVVSMPELSNFPIHIGFCELHLSAKYNIRQGLWL